MLTVRSLTKTPLIARRKFMKTLKSTLIIIIAASAFNISFARADQPHMQRALQHLRAARAELERAEHNKGGWRVHAISSVDKAIADTENGMKSAH
jgi:hypothetical protein